MRQRDLEALLAYLKENSHSYPMDSLRAQMVKAGHSLAGADRAIAVFQGKALRREPAVWGPAFLLAFADLALAFLCYTLLSRYGAGKVSCSAAALVPGLYLTELFASFILLAGGKERWGRILLLGLLIFLAMAVLVLFGLLARWLANATGK
jgi:hypothetical protein